MYTDKEIQKLKELVVEAINPNKIILFGSYAYGIPTEKSDIDLLVIMPDEELSFEEIAELGCKVIEKQLLSLEYIRNDLCIIAQTDYNDLKDVPISAVNHAERKGVILYDKNKMKSDSIKDKVRNK